MGLLVIATTVRAFTEEAAARVRWLLVGALAVFLLQIAIGALTATNGPEAVLPGLHLTLGVLVFIGTVLALAWELEDTTGTPNETPISRDPPATADDAPPVPAPSSTLEGLKLTGLAYLRLTKPRLMWLLCLVAAAGMALAAGPTLRPTTVAATLTGGVLAIGASGTFNHVLERDIDKRMQPHLRSTAGDGLRAGAERDRLRASCSRSHRSASSTQINALAAVLGLAAILFYSVIYTLVLKPNTVQNTVIGGFAGALPALIGWAAVTETIGLPAILLAGVIFLWTPAHFYNLALAYKDDYASRRLPDDARRPGRDDHAQAHRLLPRRDARRRRRARLAL
ncbi:MAG: UbiA family prenyltransferase [Natrialbaceae archaeon]|nr:UbiA family prenyltransferase [Natrialbaceae archaeon]